MALVVNARLAARALLRRSATALDSASLSGSRISSRGFASEGHHNEPPKVDFWKDPLSPSKWKEEHFVLVSLAGWGCIIYGGKKAFSGAGKKPEKGSAKH